MRNVLKAFLSLTAATCLVQADTIFQVASGDWNTTANWNADVPGVGDNNARLNNGGTINVNADPSVLSGVDFRIATGGSAVNTVNWNPGDELNPMAFTRLYVGGGAVAATANFNQDSGQIDVTQSEDAALRIGNDNTATYTMTGTSILRVNTAYTIGYFDDGNGHLVMQDDSQFLDYTNNNGEPRVGREAGAQGQITMEDNSFLDTRGNFRLGEADGAVGTLTMSGTSTFLNRNEFRVGWSGAGHVTMSEDATLLTGNGSNNDFRVGVNATGTGTVTLSGNAVIQGSAGLNADDAHIGLNGDAVLIMSGDSALTGFREFSTSHNVNASDSVVTMSGNARIEARTFVNIGRAGSSTVTLNDNARISNSENSPFNLGAQTGSNATLIMNGAGSYIFANQNLNVGGGNNVASTSLFDQNAGEVFVNGGLFVGQSAVGNAATYNLDGGTLRSNSITVDAANGVFNWGAGTMTVREVQQNASGDGSIINFAGDLASSTGSVLDLQNLYTAGSVRFDKLAVAGALDLTASGDILDFWVNVQALRGSGGIITGELQLISATSVSGTFDNIVAPGSDGLFFRTLLAGEIAQGTAADALTVNRGYLDYRGDGVYFVYKVNGQVPEPSTAAYWMIFVGLASAWRNRQRFSFFDFMISDEDDGPRDY